MNNSEKISTLLEKFKLTKEIPEPVRDHVKNNLKPSLGKILRKRNRYSIAVSFMVSLKIFTRKLGINTELITGNRIKRTAAFAATLVIFILLYTLKEKIFIKAPSEGQKIILSQGDVKIMKKRQSLSAKINHTIPDNVVIKTGSDSNIFFQNSSISLTGVMENSEAEIISRSDNSGSIISLKNGLLLSRVEKLQKIQDYIIRTPNSETHVRGTAFSIRYHNDITEVALVSGKIAVKNRTQNEKVLRNGETAIISDKIEIRKISEIEILQIQKIILLKLIKNNELHKFNISEEQARQDKAKLEQIDKKIKELIEIERIHRKAELEKWKRLPPLERLMREGKYITMFHMRDGSRVAGSIISQNETAIKLDTGDGIIKVLKKEIIRREKIK